MIPKTYKISVIQTKENLCYPNIKDECIFKISKLKYIYIILKNFYFKNILKINK